MGAGSSDWDVLATNLRVQAALLRILEELDEFPVVVFKGPLLTERIYGDLRARASSDNDLYLPEPWASRALETLLARDYRCVAGLDPWAAYRRDGQIALWKGGSADQVSVDLHARPFSTKYFDVGGDVIEAHLETVNLAGRDVTTFDRPLSYVHQVAHWVQHHFEDRLLRDLTVAFDKWSERPGFVREVASLAPRTCGMEAVQVAQLEACRVGLSKGSLSGRILPRALAASRVLGSPVASRSVVRKFLALFLGAPHKLPRGIASALFLEPDDLRSRYGKGNWLRLTLRHAAITIGERQG